MGDKGPYEERRPDNPRLGEESESREPEYSSRDFLSRGLDHGVFAHQDEVQHFQHGGRDKALVDYPGGGPRG